MTPLYRIAALLAVLALAVAACGGDDDAATTTTSDEATTTSAGDAPTTTSGDAAPTTAAPVNNGNDVADAGETVLVHYTGTLDDGTEFDSSVGSDPFQFTLAAGDVIPGFDEAVTGLTVGESATVTIPVADAYGEPDPAAIVEVPIEDFPAELAVVGTQVDAGGFPATVVEVTEETVTVDANHPLAGENLTFEIELVEIL